MKRQSRKIRLKALVAQVVKSVDALDSKSSRETYAGSSPALGTIKKQAALLSRFLFKILYNCKYIAKQILQIRCIIKRNEDIIINRSIDWFN